MDKGLHREGRKVSAPIRREIVKELNTTAYVLYEYYVEKAEAPNYDLFNDKLVGQILGLSTQTVQKTRLSLQKNNFIFFSKRVAGDIEAHDYVIGKDRVMDHLGLCDTATAEDITCK